MGQYQSILYEEKNKIGILKINNPENLNALDYDTLIEIEKVLLSILNESESVRFLIITGAGNKAFAAGADIKEMADKNTLTAREFSQLGNRVSLLIEKLPIPTLAVVNGYALGGGLEIAMACDLRFASTKAVVGLPEVDLGLIPGFGGTQRLSRIVGLPKAKELIYSARNIKAPEGLSIGLFNQVFTPEDLMKEALEYAETVVAKAPIAIEFAKQAITTGYDMTLEQSVGLETELFGSIFSTEDHSEGIQAFIDKRKPVFKNK